jgi:hypothetical protein
MAYAADPGGIFASDAHRRILGHLATPDATYGWEVTPLLARVGPDPHTPFDQGDESGISTVLNDLASEGYAKCHEGGVWVMTQAGFDALAGPIANEPGPGAAPSAPAPLGPLRPTPLGNGNGAVPERPSEVPSL